MIGRTKGPALAALVVVGVALCASALLRADAWKARAESALQQADSALVVAANARVREGRLAAANDSLVAALEVERRRVRERVVVERVAEEVPDSCAGFVAWRDQVIDDLIAEADGYRRAWQQEREARRSLAVAYEALEESHDSLATVLRVAPGVAPSFFERLVPDLRFGVFAGLDTNLRPTMGVGLSLGWEPF